MEYEYVKKVGDLFRPLNMTGQSDFDELDEAGKPLVHHSVNVFTSFTTEELQSRLNIYQALCVPVPEGEEPTGDAIYSMVDGVLSKVYPTRTLPTSGNELVLNKHLGRDLTEEERASLEKINQTATDIRAFTVFGGLHIRDYVLEKIGDMHQGHKHRHDHVTYLHSGKVMCNVEGYPDKVFEGPVPITIKKDLFHRFIALVPNTSYSCIFAWRDEQGEITDIYTGDQSPYGWQTTTTEELAKLVQGGCASCLNSAGCSAT